MVDDDVLDRDQHQKDDGADDVIAADHEVPERLDHISSRRGSQIAVHQDEAGRGNIQRQTKQRQQ